MCRKILTLDIAARLSELKVASLCMVFFFANLTSENGKCFATAFPFPPFPQMRDLEYGA
jgi:hypothetical protein